MRMLLSFQRPPCLFGEDIPGEDRSDPTPEGAFLGRPGSIALRTDRGKLVACRGNPKSGRCITQHRRGRGRNARLRRLRAAVSSAIAARTRNLRYVLLILADPLRYAYAPRQRPCSWGVDPPDSPRERTQADRARAPERDP